jgi:hypothetical protein
VVDDPELGRCHRIVGAAFDGQHALGRGGQQQRRGERRGARVEQAEPRQPRHRQDQSVDLAVGELAQAGADVATDRHDLKLTAGGSQNGGPPR